MTRRRGQSLITAILDATWAELEAVGYADLTIESVAERAQASKASIYRRWDGKPQLVYAATRLRFPQQAEIPDTGSLRGDLIAFVEASIEVLAGPAGAAIRGIVSDSLQAGITVGELRSNLESSTQQAMTAVLERARSRGEVVSAEVSSLRLEAGHAVLRFHFLLGGGELDPGFVERVVDEVMLPLLRSE